MPLRIRSVSPVRSYPAWKVGDRGPHDWSPKKPRRIPGEKNIFLEENIDWDGREWREPDEDDAGHTGVHASWYGVGGIDALEATTAVWRTSLSGWTIKEYRFIPEEKSYLVRRTFVAAQTLSDALFSILGLTVSEEDIWDDRKRWIRYAVSLGVLRLAYKGGDEDWANKIPRPPS